MIDPKVLVRVTAAMEQAEHDWMIQEWGVISRDLGPVPIMEVMATAALTEVRKIQIEEQEQIARAFDDMHRQLEEHFAS